MKKSISVIYELCFGLAILFLVYLSFFPGNELYSANSIEEFCFTEAAGIKRRCAG